MWYPLEDWFDLGYALVRSAHVLEEQGRLEAALNRYLAALRVSRHIAQKGGVDQYVAGRAFAEYVYYWINGWAAHREQTPELLQQAVEAVRREAERLPGPAAALNVQYGALERTVKEGKWEDLPGFWRSYGPWVRVLPWERTALVRSLRFMQEVSYWRLKCLERDLRSSHFAFSSWLIPTVQAVPRGEARWQGFIRPRISLDKAEGATDTFGGHGFYPALQELTASTMSHETRLRALRIVLALAAYRLDRGRLPDALEQLVPDYLTELPLDPWIGRPFGYQPSGVPGSVSIALLPNWLKALPAGRAFLWSGGVFNAHLAPSARSGEQTGKGQDYLLVDATGEPVKETKWRQFSGLRFLRLWPPLRFSDQIRDIGFDFWGGMLFPIPGDRACERARE